MGTAFYSEAQIWPWISDSEFVMFAINWSDKPDLVCHRFHSECKREEPHLMSECGRFKEERAMGSTGNDPRTDQHERPHQQPKPGESPSYPAPGGAGTGTHNDPARQPDSTPDDTASSPSKQ